jgi:hypothetical protein
VGTAGHQAALDYLPLHENVAISLGELSIGVLATPGHTPEHVTYTVTIPKQLPPAAIFTGGALIVGGAARTDLLGVYTVTPIAGPGATSSPSGSPGGSPAATPAAASPASSGDASAIPSPTFRPADPNAPVRFAVDLLDVDESNIAPGDPAKIAALGRPEASPGTGAAPGASGSGASTGEAPAPMARDELWIPIVLAALAVLLIEWLVYERDTLLRLRRSAARRLHGGDDHRPGRAA